MQTFEPPVQPLLDHKLKEDYRAKVIQFGDGYSQRSPDGLNSVDESASLKFVGTEAEIKQIQDFMRSHKGARSFWYQHPWSDNPQMWTCSSLERRQVGRRGGDRVFELSLSLKLVFDLV